MSFPVLPPPDHEVAAAPAVQSWRMEQAAPAEAQPAEALPKVTVPSNLPPCDPPLKPVTPATAPAVKSWRVTFAPSSQASTAPCRPFVVTTQRPGALPFRLNEGNRERLRPVIRQVAAAYRLEPALLHAVISAESGYDTLARSLKGAQGLMQLMPDTARRFGVLDPDKPLENLSGGARYLRWLLDLFDDLGLALAGYNAGENAVIRYGNTIPPYPETQAYVRRVLWFYRQYQRTPFF